MPKVKCQPETAVNITESPVNADGGAGEAAHNAAITHPAKMTVLEGFTCFNKWRACTVISETLDLDWIHQPFSTALAYPIRQCGRAATRHQLVVTKDLWVVDKTRHLRESSRALGNTAAQLFFAVSRHLFDQTATRFIDEMMYRLKVKQWHCCVSFRVRLFPKSKSGLSPFSRWRASESVVLVYMRAGGQTPGCVLGSISIR